MWNAAKAAGRCRNQKKKKKDIKQEIKHKETPPLEMNKGSGANKGLKRFLTADPAPNVKYIQLIMTFIRF